MTHDEMPMGFGMALSKNPAAMKAFAMLSEDEKKEIIAGTHSVQSKEEMHQYVNKLISET